MQTAVNKTLLVVIDDLFFTVKINDAAKRAGLAAKFVKSERDAIEAAKDQPAAIIIDLNCNSVDTLELIRKLKGAEESKSISLIGFVSHVQGDLKRQAQEAGCEMVLARSAFSQNLPQIFKRHGAAD